MANIPEDVCEVALSAWKASGRMSMLREGDPWEPIARAIMAERERCAKVVEDSAAVIDHPSVYMGGASHSARRTAKVLAAAIREGTSDD
jgi:hypothetical protein